MPAPAGAATPAPPANRRRVPGGEPLAGRGRPAAGARGGAVYGATGLSMAEAYAHPSLPIARTLQLVLASRRALGRGTAGFPVGSRAGLVAGGGGG
jgi:hypothetical protein